MQDIIVTTRDLNRPYEIVDVLFAVTSEGFHAGLDLIAKWKDIFGGRVKGYDKNINKTLTRLLEDLKDQAKQLDCHAVIGIDHKIASIPIEKNAAIVVTMTGTAIRLLNQQSSRANG